ncbi:MAG: cytochrome c [Myxococcota bacterium]|nr:cytochrome c [Myxococcota bacterium]
MPTRMGTGTVRGWGLGTALVLGLLLGACSPGQPAQAGEQPVATAAAAATPAAPSPELLKKGQRLYAGRCAGCHELYPPASRSADHWRTWVPAMAPRSGLTPEESQRLLDYLVASAAPKP